MKKGKALAAKQQYDDALELFREATKIDSHEPDAHYQAGMVLCEQRLYQLAIEEYEICEKLASGWYFSRSDLWVASQLALGVLPHEVFLALRFLQDGPPNNKERLEIAERVRPQADSIPLFSFWYGKALEGAGRLKEAADHWHAALQEASELDVRTRLLITLSPLEQDPDKRRQMLEEAVNLNGNLIAAAGAALSLRMGKQASK